MKRFLLALLLLTAPLFLRLPQAHAIWIYQTPQESTQKQDQSVQGNLHQGGAVWSARDNDTWYLNCQLAGQGCPTIVPPGQPQTYYQQKSVLGMTSSAISTMYINPPADLAYWIQDTGQALGFIPRQAYAQGAGFTGLAPLLSLWRMFRNIAYVLIAFGIIIVGFMVMFRKKIDPKTVVTVQNALPRIIMTLILITFSYAIVGLLIDLMYIILLLAYSLFDSATNGEIASRCGLPTLVFDFGGVISRLGDALATALGGGSGTSFSQVLCENTRSVILQGNLFQVFNVIFPGNITDIAQLSTDIMGLGGSFDWAGETISGIVDTALGFAPLGPFGALPTLIISIILIFLFIRLAILFLSAYIQIIISLIFGPIQLLFGVFPGNDAFGSWLKNLIANLSVFVIAGIMFMLAITFGQAVGSQSGNVWTPPYYTLFGSSARSITALFTLGVLTIIPTLANQVKQALKAQGTGGLGTLLGPASTGLGMGMQLAYQGSFIMSSIRGHGKGASTSTTNPVEKLTKGDKAHG